MTRLLLIFSLLLAFSTNTFGWKETYSEDQFPTIYDIDIIIAGSLKSATVQDGVQRSTMDAIDYDILQKNSSLFYGRIFENDFELPASQKSIDLDASIGFYPGRLPLLKIASLRDFIGLRFNLGLSMLPYSKAEVFKYTGPVKYYDSSNNEIRNYTGTITSEQDFFYFLPRIGLYYMHESGIVSDRIKPFAGIDVGIHFASYRLKHSFSTNTFTDSQYNYSAKADFQETAINAANFWSRAVAGLRVYMDSGVSLEGRIHYQLTDVKMKTFRTGSFQESKQAVGTASSVIYAQRERTQSGSINYLQSGLEYSIGVAIGLR